VRAAGLAPRQARRLAAVCGQSRRQPRTPTSTPVLATPAVPGSGHARGTTRLASLRCAGARECGTPARRAPLGNRPSDGD
jgi:hypothetical protein